MDAGYLFISAIDRGATLVVHAARGCDMGLVGYEMAMLASRAGHALTPGPRTGIPRGPTRRERTDASCPCTPSAPHPGGRPRPPIESVASAAPTTGRRPAASTAPSSTSPARPSPPDRRRARASDPAEAGTRRSRPRYRR
jgi:hypothetical protein